MVGLRFTTKTDKIASMIGSGPLNIRACSKLGRIWVSLARSGAQDEESHSIGVSKPSTFLRRGVNFDTNAYTNAVSQRSEG